MPVSLRVAADQTGRGEFLDAAMTMLPGVTGNFASASVNSLKLANGLEYVDNAAAAAATLLAG